MRIKIEDTLSKVSNKYGTKEFSLVRELVDIIIGSKNSHESLLGKQKDLEDLEKYLQKICRQILDLKNDEFHSWVEGMKPLYLKVKEIHLRYQQVENRLNECERSVKNQGGIDQIDKLQNNALYYEEMERGFGLLEKYETKFIKAAEYESRKDYIMCVRTLKKIERQFIANKKELSDFPDIIEIVSSNLSNFYSSLREELQGKIINFLFMKNAEVQKIIMAKIIKEVKAENKKTKTFKEDEEEAEDFFEFISRTEFPLSDHIKLLILKTLSRKDRKDNIKKIKRILKKYQEDQLDTGVNNIEDSEYSQSQEILQKVSIFFSDFSEAQLILNRSEAYLISCVTALKALDTESVTDLPSPDSNNLKFTNFLTQSLLHEFPKTLWSAIKAVVVHESKKKTQNVDLVVDYYNDEEHKDATESKFAFGNIYSNLSEYDEDGNVNPLLQIGEWSTDIVFIWCSWNPIRWYR